MRGAKGSLFGASPDSRTVNRGSHRRPSIQSGHVHRGTGQGQMLGVRLGVRPSTLDLDAAKGFSWRGGFRVRVRVRGGIRIGSLFLVFLVFLELGADASPCMCKLKLRVRTCTLRTRGHDICHYSGLSIQFSVLSANCGPWSVVPGLLRDQRRNSGRFRQ